jgi:hypothetical protein
MLGIEGLVAFLSGRNRDNTPCRSRGVVDNFANFEVFVFLFGRFPPRIEEPGFPTGGSRLLRISTNTDKTCSGIPFGINDPAVRVWKESTINRHETDHLGREISKLRAVFCNSLPCGSSRPLSVSARIRARDLRHASKPDAQARISGPLALRETVRVRDLPPTGARGVCSFARARFQDVKEQAARSPRLYSGEVRVRASLPRSSGSLSRRERVRALHSYYSSRPSETIPANLNYTKLWISVKGLTRIF